MGRRRTRHRARRGLGLEGGRARRRARARDPGAREATDRPLLGRLARAGVRRLRRPLRAAAAELARRQRDAPRRAARPPPRRPARGGVLSRARTRPDPSRAALGVQDDSLHRGGRRSVRARRHLRDPAPVVARLGRARLVPRAARLHLPRPLGAAGELRLQHRERAATPPSRLDLPLAARDLVPARGRATRRGCVADTRPAARPDAAPLVRTRRAPLRRPPVDALALVVSRTRARARRHMPSRAARRHPASAS